MSNRLVSSEMILPVLDRSTIWRGTASVSEALNIDHEARITDEVLSMQRNNLAAAVRFACDVEFSDYHEISDYLNNGEGQLFARGSIDGGKFINNRAKVISDPASRLYFNPGYTGSAELFSRIRRAVVSETGEEPAGKFRFDGVRPGAKHHKDRVVMYPKTGNEAKVILEEASKFTPLASRPTAPFAHGFKYGDVDMSWAGIGEDPDEKTSMSSKPESLTSSRVLMLIEARKNIVGDSFESRNVVPDAEQLADEVGCVAIDNGVSPKSFSFNASTNVEKLCERLDISLVSI